MRVLIISAFPPDPAPEANHALHLSEHLAKAGVDVDVLCKTGSIAATQSNIAVHPVIDAWTWSDLPKLVRAMRRCRPDVVLLLYIAWVYNHHPMITFLPTICKAILPGVPCITQFENIDTGFPPRSFLTRALRSLMALWAGRKNVHSIFGTLLRDSARIVVLSSPHRARLAAHSPEIEGNSAIVPPPPIIRVCQEDPLTARRQARAAIGASDSDFVLVYWGYVYPGKGVETLLKAFRIVCNSNQNIRLVIVGGSLEFPTGPISCSDYFQMVRELPDRLGIAERVTWTGHFSWDSDSGSRYLRAGDACVLPFDYGVTLNNSSLAAASTHDLPVISTDLPVGRDEALEHGRNIYLCPPQDVKALAEAIELVSGNADLRERLRLGIRTLAREWHSWDRMTGRLLGILAASREEARARLAADQRDQAQLSPAVWSDEIIADGNRPLVSVVVAVHNIGKYLSQCLDSLVNQTLKSLEIIVVNDASQDNSPEIINDYATRYPQLIRVVTCESNKGLASVRNIGMKVARGSYIGFTDGDDWADIRMFDVMSRRAQDDNADVVIADATVFYDDSKTFGQFFDQHVRKTLPPEIKTMPFDLRTEPRVMLLEPVAWTKLYKRSFLQKHALQFEDGMNSYEDICFHVSVLLKATRVSFLDEPLPFYRQNRPGQISARTDRKIFEVFAVFDKIHANLAAWGVSADIWALLVKVELRQLDWLLKDRVPSSHKREFLALAARQLRRIPAAGFQAFARQANRDELTKLLCMRRNWLYAYGVAVSARWPVFPLLYFMAHPRRREVLARGFRRGVGMVRRRLISTCRAFAKRLLGWAAMEQRLQAVTHSVSQLLRAQRLPSHSEEPLVEVCRIREQALLLSRSENSGLAEAMWRMQHDVYLSQTVAFRPGDTVVDVGAHLGVFAIYLAKRYPFIHVYAIEPDPANYASLKRNIELNGLGNVTAINKAISGDGQKRRLYTNASFNGWATIDGRTALSQTLLRSADVDTMTLDDLFDQYEIRHCRLLKITAPGAVQESLKAFTRTGCVDLLCGEVDLDDCSRPRLELASWRIARQHFWRTIARRGNGTVSSWLHQAPREIEPSRTTGRSG